VTITARDNEASARERGLPMIPPRYEAGMLEGKIRRAASGARPGHSMGSS
jgi:hypothetical protein